MATMAKSSVSKTLSKALMKIDRPGSYCTFGSAPNVLPGLEVERLGSVGLPLTASQGKQLKKHCEQAAYGKGEQTLVDTKVRCAWRLGPGRFTIANPAWKKCLATIVTQVQGELGLERQKLEPHLHELLLYEKGGFFLPHRDGEKLNRMVATLVVMLPSAYEGGELVVRHEGREEVIDFNGQDTQFSTHFAAFYADCEHEIKPLRSGYRLCLVYNLTLATKKKPIGAPRSAEHVASVANILRHWSDEGDGPDKLAVTLAHQYTEKGLNWDALKGVDRAKADVLARAAEQSGCQAHLALLTLWECGSAEYADESPRRRGTRYRDHDESGEYEMVELIDSSLTAEHWRTPTGGRAAFGVLPVEREQVVPADSLTAVTPEEEFEGFTGNAGMTLDRWYRHAAIFLWPNHRHFDVLVEGGSQQAVAALDRMVAAWRKATGVKAEEQKKHCIEFAQRILDAWPANAYHKYAEEESEADPMRSLERLGELPLIRTYLRNILVKDVSLTPGPALTRVVVRHGWETFRPELTALFEATDRAMLERHVRILERLCLTARDRQVGKDEREAARQTCRVMAEATVTALIRIDDTKSNDWRAAGIKRATVLARLVRATVATELDDLLARIVAHTQNHPEQYPVVRVQVDALNKLDKWLKEKLDRRSQPLLDWIAKCRHELETMTACAPQPPRDFKREAAVKCTCRECAELNRFLSDPKQHEHRFQMRQERRDHLANNIRSYQCDLDCITDKRPRPQVLICTKNMASHERSVKEYHENLQHLAALKSLGQCLLR